MKPVPLIFLLRGEVSLLGKPLKDALEPRSVKTQDLTLPLSSVLCLWLESYPASSVVLRPGWEAGLGIVPQAGKHTWKKKYTEMKERKKRP